MPDSSVLVFDYRYLGASEGEPRGQVIWYEQTEDYQNAITWVSLQKEADPNRVGVWGSSYSGSHVLHLGAYDKRINAVVAQVPAINSRLRLQRFVSPDKLDGFFEWLAQDRVERLTKGAVNYVPVVGSTGQPSSLPTQESHDWFIEASKRAPNWINKVTIESIEKAVQYHPTANIRAVSPTPLLIIVASHDTIAPTDQVIDAYQRA